MTHVIIGCLPEKMYAQSPKWVKFIPETDENNGYEKGLTYSGYVASRFHGLRTKAFWPVGHRSVVWSGEGSVRWIHRGSEGCSTQSGNWSAARIRNRCQGALLLHAVAARQL